MRHGATLPLGSVVGAAVVAAALGSLAFFAPEGVGVKDGVLVALLTHAAGLSLATGMAAALAVRALDPLTKLGLLGLLGATANGVPSRLLAAPATWLPRMKAHTLAPSRRVAVRRRRVAILGASLLTLATVLSGYGAFAHGDQDVVAAHELRPPALDHAVSSSRRPVPLDAAIVAVFRANAHPLTPDRCPPVFGARLSGQWHENRQPCPAAAGAMQWTVLRWAAPPRLR